MWRAKIANPDSLQILVLQLSVHVEEPPLGQLVLIHSGRSDASLRNHTFAKSARKRTEDDWLHILPTSLFFLWTEALTADFRRCRCTADSRLTEKKEDENSWGLRAGASYTQKYQGWGARTPRDYPWLHYM